jgi:undecaprenyl-diphosphatase
LVKQSGLYKSFPSNHAANSAALATVFSMVYPHLRFILWGLATTVMFSRVYIGVHYPLDIISGGLLGFFYGLLFAKGWNYFTKDSFPIGQK